MVGEFLFCEVGDLVQFREKGFPRNPKTAQLVDYLSLCFFIDGDHHIPGKGRDAEAEHYKGPALPDYAWVVFSGDAEEVLDHVPGIEDHAALLVFHAGISPSIFMP